MINKMPHWLSGGFGHLEYEADFEFWGQMEAFELHEALLLSVGVEPRHFDNSKLDQSAKAMKTKSLLAPIEFLVRRREQFDRKYPSGGYGKLRASPQFLYDWFTDVSLAVHPLFLDVLRRRVEGKASPQGSVSQVEVAPAKTDQREVDKIAQLFTVMAIDHLGYDPKAKRSPASKEIADLAAGMGLSVTDDTVRKYLKLGARFIPKDWKPM